MAPQMYGAPTQPAWGQPPAKKKSSMPIVLAVLGVLAVLVIVLVALSGNDKTDRPDNHVYTPPGSTTPVDPPPGGQTTPPAGAPNQYTPGPPDLNPDRPPIPDTWP